MVAQIKPVLCPKCRKSVLGISRFFGGNRRLVSVEIHHHEDAQRGWHEGGPTLKTTCKECKGNGIVKVGPSEGTKSK